MKEVMHKIGIALNGDAGDMRLLYSQEVDPGWN